MVCLKNKIALITGSTRGIGKGIALTLAGRGAEVIINCPPFDPETGDILDQIRENGGKAHLIVADVSKNEEVHKMFGEVRRRFGRLDILVNNAGTSEAKNIFEIDEAGWRRILETNLSSGFFCSKNAMEMMKEQGYGKIVFISSVVGHRGALFGHAHYAASKSGQLGLVKTLSITGAPLGINVNAVAPGIIETELLYKTHGRAGVEDLAKTIPLGLGKTEDVGNAVAFLCSDEARYITGVTLDVNGGVYLR